MQEHGEHGLKDKVPEKDDTERKNEGGRYLHGQVMVKERKKIWNHGVVYACGTGATFGAQMLFVLLFRPRQCEEKHGTAHQGSQV